MTIKTATSYLTELNWTVTKTARPLFQPLGFPYCGLFLMHTITDLATRLLSCSRLAGLASQHEHKVNVCGVSMCKEKICRQRGVRSGLVGTECVLFGV